MSLTDIEKRYLQLSISLSSLCVGFVVLRWAITGSNRFWFLVENLILAALGLAFSWLMLRRLTKVKYFDWQAGLLGVAWLVFLPNSWYVLTDFIHVEPTAEISQLYDIAMVCSLVVCGFLFGFTSLYLIHRRLVKHLTSAKAAVVVLLIILLASFAIYLGRDLRWNTWDILTDPGGLILSVTDRLLNPFGNPRLFNVTGLFFGLISICYFAIWQFLRPYKHK